MITETQNFEGTWRGYGTRYTVEIEDTSGLTGKYGIGRGPWVFHVFISVVSPEFQDLRTRTRCVGSPSGLTGGTKAREKARRVAVAAFKKAR